MCVCVYAEVSSIIGIKALKIKIHSGGMTLFWWVVRVATSTNNRNAKIGYINMFFFFFVNIYVLISRYMLYADGRIVKLHTIFSK